jgi:hypothetical protein
VTVRATAEEALRRGSETGFGLFLGGCREDELKARTFAIFRHYGGAIHNCLATKTAGLREWQHLCSAGI